MSSYPLAEEALQRLLGEAPMAARPRGAPEPLSAFAVGPGVLRPPPAVQVKKVEAEPDDDDAAGPAPSFEIRGETRGEMRGEMLGELLDMVLVGADKSASGSHEVHLMFKADVLGGLRLRLTRDSTGMQAVFLVSDAHARRMVADHVDALIAHLKERGFSITSHSLEVEA